MTKVIGDLDSSTIHEVWNSPEMREVRLNMLSGNSCSEYCERCYSKEEDGFTSLRRHMNQSYADRHWDIVNSTQEDGSVPSLNLVHWDFRFSNVCNQKCRTCGIEFSTRWHGDYIKLWKLDESSAPQRVKKIWNSVEAFEKDFESLFDKVEYIHFAGGEPLITDEHYRVLEKLIKLGRRDVKIRYSTNFSVLTYKNYNILEMWKHFDYIELMASLDDYGDRYNYLRNGSDWEQIVSNFNKVKSSGLFNRKNIRWGLHPTISFWNVYYMPDFHRECIRLGIVDPKRRNGHFASVFHLNNLIDPPWFNCQLLPADYKKQVSEKLLAYADELEREYNIPSDDFRNIVHYMNSADLSDQIPMMQDIVKRMDDIRSDDSKKVFPFLKDLFL